MGPALAGRLERLGIVTCFDLLMHRPFRYEDRTRITPIAALRDGQLACIEGEISAVRTRHGPRTSLDIALRDSSGSIDVRFFHFGAAQARGLVQGRPMRCVGTPRMGRRGHLELYHPEYRAGELPALPDHLTAIYPSTEGLSQARLRAWIDALLDNLRTTDPSDALLADGPPLREALLAIHHPDHDTDAELLRSGFDPATRRLATEELAAHLLSQRAHADRQRHAAAPRIALPTDAWRLFREALPFEPTPDQRRVVRELIADLGRERPMRRLLQGDVGSGKTVVAAAALYAVTRSGFQGALMAPTALLAEQHFATLSTWLEPLGIRCALLTGSTTRRQRAALLKRLAGHDIDVLIGTHAIYQSDVEFARLALVVIDEQHRFGVHQRFLLQRKPDSNQPHQLVMTATPIPRTLAMSIYANLDTSVIRSPPANRKPVTTAVVAAERRSEVIDRMRRALGEGRQAYWICTLVEESEQFDAEAAETTAERLSSELAGFRVGLVHGKLAGRDKQARMQAFRDGRIDLLVATTVIEVGVDVPNASLMVIENANRLGLAQLHQLRGRVGRGGTESYCVLMYDHNLSERGRARLEVMRDSNDGFLIAERDLELRGPGDVLGTRQTGLAQFRVADLARDHALIPTAEHLARAALHHGLAERLQQRWSFGTGDYAKV